LRKSNLGVLTGATLLAIALPAAAHHSFAVFFDETRMTTVEGVVKAFRFTNPHGTIVLDVTGTDGRAREYRVETNAPVILQRRGWSRNSLKAGDRVTVEGWPARDGKPYLRLRAARDARGQPIGGAFTAQED
jgi:hypothetical protein